MIYDWQFGRKSRLLRSQNSVHKSAFRHIRYAQPNAIDLANTKLIKQWKLAY